MLKTLATATLIAVSTVFVGCNEINQPAPKKNTDQQQQQQTAQAMNEANRQIGMPNISNFNERRLMKMIMELRDQEDLVTYTYIVTLTGDTIFLGRSIGYGLPYSVQFTNPERVAVDRTYRGHNGASYSDWGTLPQPDPNGLFMPEGLSATWVMLVDEDGEPRPVYVENEIIVSPFPIPGLTPTNAD